ncbi:M20/M25/M40 family metallo-hydrolase [Pelobacter propionicus]|uniref:Peptidase T-like protein n=1 Tax=Pelobacter propionicus (strain DSM 2379 / NBRC 103807 / OttBd1) TaxID=338966 RepID=A1AS52_PELPD|nr:M20/M25/M40 family metallo-hydrolase [Pelobacter propionicus]ABL00173.1 peptidase T-like protein [Pelobacter propionicus DSM 2379]
MTSIPRHITRQRLFATFMELCAIDSEPGRERQMADFLRERLTGLGCSVSEDRAGQPTNGNTGNLHARLEGSGPGEALFLSCHLDRVAPGTGVRPRIQGEYLVSDGTTVLGADDGAGLAAILEALTTIREHRIPHPTLEIVLTVAEELALAGVRHFDISRLEARSGFVLDAAGRVGQIVVQAPEKVNFRAVFHGRSAHAGFSPEQGISAIQMAALAISRMRLLRIDPETTVNLGSISAQGASNIVPEFCELSGEIRSLDPAKVRAQLEAIERAMESAATELGGSTELRVTERYPAYQLAEETKAARRAARAARRIGAPLLFTSTGGGSDANIFNSRGRETVVLSCGYEHAHTTAERISLEQLSLLAEWVLALIVDDE